jgi:hypothetical protein
MSGIWKYIVLAVFVATMVGVVFALHLKLHSTNVELEAGRLANDLSATIKRVHVAPSEGFSENYSLPSSIGGFEYSISIENNEVIVKVPDLNIIQRAPYGEIQVELIGSMRPGEIVVITKSDSTVTMSGT